jgi:anti-sigma B factor antagonist
LINDRGDEVGESALDLSVSSSQDDGITTLTVIGELDIATRDSATNEISRAVHADGVRTVVVDVSGVRFLDSSGISVLLHGRREAEATGVSYLLTGATGMVREVLAVTGVLAHLSGESV